MRSDATTGSGPCTRHGGLPGNPAETAQKRGRGPAHLPLTDHRPQPQIPEDRAGHQVLSPQAGATVWGELPPPTGHARHDLHACVPDTSSPSVSQPREMPAAQVPGTPWGECILPGTLSKPGPRGCSPLRGPPPFKTRYFQILKMHSPLTQVLDLSFTQSTWSVAIRVGDCGALPTLTHPALPQRLALVSGGPLLRRGTMPPVGRSRPRHNGLLKHSPL